MKCAVLIILFASGLSCFGQQKNWEQLSQSEKTQIMQNPKIPHFALDFYNNKYDLSQDSLVLDFLNKVALNKNENILPFYYFLFIKMCNVGDGYIGEVLGSCCINILSNHPKYVFDRLNMQLKNGDKREYSIFKSHMAFEFYASGLEHSYPNRPSFNEFETLLKKKTNSTNKDLMTKLLSEVKITAIDMINKDKNLDGPELIPKPK